ncbi:hypothetical protein PG996_010487 [Apiospora saccharicola]|uniref:Uncharacterized protein n=1 Tax=Apiospora saccharicola TaxID=335842 RepID=A0ABR1UNR0_9PEZI
MRSRLAGLFSFGGVVHLGLRLIVDFLRLGGFIVVGSGFGDWGFIMCCGCIGCLELFLVGKLAQSLDNLLIRDQLLRITVCRLLRLLRLGISSWRGGFSGFRLSFLGGFLLHCCWLRSSSSGWFRCLRLGLLLRRFVFRRIRWLTWLYWEFARYRCLLFRLHLSGLYRHGLGFVGWGIIGRGRLRLLRFCRGCLVCLGKFSGSCGLGRPRLFLRSLGRSGLYSRFFGGGGTEGSRTARLRAFRPGASDSPAPPRPLSFAQSTHSSLFLELADPLLAVLDIPPRLFLDGVHLEFGLVLGGVHVAVELLLALLVLPGPARLELLVFLAPAPFALFVFDPPRLDDAVALRLSLPVELGPLPFVRRAQVREQRVPLLLQLIEAGVVLLDRQKRGDGLVDLRQVVVHLLH